MNSIKPKVIIIILNWNGKQDTLECLSSVEKIEYENFDTIVVDNGSQDGSVAAIQKKFPQVTIIENRANLGFAEGNNVGIEYALSQGSDYIFLLNNDTIVDSQVLSELIDASDRYPDAGILGSKIYQYYQPEKIWYAGTEWKANVAEFSHIGWGQIDNDLDWAEIKETEYVCGCAFLIKTEVVKKVGMLEPKYFLTWEETDLCYRAKKAGYRSIFVPNSKLWHKVSASFGGNKAPHYQYFWWRNRLLWIERNFGFAQAAKLYPVIFYQIARQVRRYFHPHTSSQEKLKIKAALQGVKDYLMRKFGGCPSWVHSQTN